MPHPVVVQLRFTRAEWRRGLAGLGEEDARRRIGPANSISWMVGHLAWQEQRYWIRRLQGLEPVEPRLVDDFCFGCPPSTPPPAEMWAIWERVVAAGDPVLDTLTTADLELERAVRSTDGTTEIVTAGSLMYRVIYHYWFHLGEAMGLRQAMGHEGLPEFVGDIDTAAPFVPF